MPEVLLVGAICVLALAMRLVFLAQWADTQLFHDPVGDELNFHHTALALLGLGPDTDVFLYQPLYSFYLAGVYALFGVGVATARTLQLIIGVGTCLLFYGLGRELGGRKAGRISALGAALYGPLVFFEGHLLAPGLTIPLLTGSLWCLLAAARRERAGLLFPSGLLLGAAMMGRPNLVAVVAVVAGWLLLRRAGPGRRLVPVAVTLAGLITGLAPSWIHNASRGSFAPVSTAGGIMFFLGNNPEATGIFHVPRSEAMDPSGHQAFRESMSRIAEAAAGHGLTPSQVSSYWYRRGIEFWKASPGRALALAGKKVLLAVNATEAAIHHSFDFGKDRAPHLGLLLTFGVVFPFSVVGFWLNARREGVGLLGLCSLAYLLTLVVFCVSDRYRILLLPMLLPVAGLGVVAWTRKLRGGPARAALVPGVVLLAAFGVSQLPVFPAAYRERAVARGYNNLGKVQGDHGDLAAAEASFRRAVELAGRDPDLPAWNNLGRVHELRGDPEAARRAYLGAVRHQPANRHAPERLARLAEAAGDLPEAIRWWDILAERLDDPQPALRQIARLRAQLEAAESANP